MPIPKVSTMRDISSAVLKTSRLDWRTRVPPRIANPGYASAVRVPPRFDGFTLKWSNRREEAHVPIGKPARRGIAAAQLPPRSFLALGEARSTCAPRSRGRDPCASVACASAPAGIQIARLEPARVDLSGLPAGQQRAAVERVHRTRELGQQRQAVGDAAGEHARIAAAERERRLDEG